MRFGQYYAHSALNISTHSSGKTTTASAAELPSCKVSASAGCYSGLDKNRRRPKWSIS